MPKGNPLYHLIRNITSREEEHIESSISNREGQNSDQLLYLYKAIRKISSEAKATRKAFSDKEITEKIKTAVALQIKDKKFLKHLSYWKSILNKELLFALGELHLQKDPVLKIQRTRSNIQILLGKGLIDDAITEIKKGKEEAKRNGLNLYYLELELLRRNLAHEHGHKLEVGSRLDNLRKDFNSILDKILVEYRLFEIYEDSYIALRNNNANLTEVYDNLPFRQQDAIREKVRLQDLTFSSKFYYYFPLSIYERIKGNHFKSKKYLEILIDLYEQKPSYKSIYQSRYIHLLNNYINNCYLIKDLKAFQETTEKLFTLKPVNERMEIKKLENLHYHRLILYLTRREYFKVTELSKEIETNLHKYEKVLPLSRWMVFHYNIAISYLIKHDLRNAEKWNSKIINHKNGNIRRDIRRRSTILSYLLLPFDEDWSNKKRKNEFRISHYGKSLKKAYKRNKLTGEPDFYLIETILVANDKFNDISEVTKLFMHLKENLSLKPGMEEFIDWIDTRFYFK